MTTFGRRTGRTPLGRPNNTGMGSRANRQLEASAAWQASKYNNSLAVDGPEFYFWRKTDGSLPCSCSNAPGSRASQTEAGEANATSRSSFGDDVDTDYDDLDSVPPPSGSLESLFGDIRLDPGYQNRQSNVNDKLRETEGSGRSGFEDIDDSDIIADLENGDRIDDPFGLFKGKTIDCPICLGTGYVDSWQLYGGARVILATGREHRFSPSGNVVIDDQENPTLLRGGRNSTVTWTWKIPLVWEQVLRIELYNGSTTVRRDAYTLTINNTPLSPASLDTFKNTGATVTIELGFETTVEFTHAEIIIAYRPAFRAQIPEVAQGYEQEFLDWNVNVSVELPTNVKISEGDYLTESKYGKVWKVSVLTPRVTNGGTVFGLGADLRALHQFERRANQLALFDPNARKSRG